jgi:hypothetical protein
VKKNLDNRYLVKAKDEIEFYYVFNVYDSITNDTITLLSEKKAKCELKDAKKIIVNNYYDFEIQKLGKIRMVDSVYVSVGKGFKYGDIVISDRGKRPFLILNSCNGYLREE